jgi:hypothetical protein
MLEVTKEMTNTSRAAFSPWRSGASVRAVPYITPAVP